MSDRDKWLKQCEGFGWDDRLGSGHQANSELCLACADSQPDRHAACAAEAKAGRKKVKKENIVENENVDQTDAVQEPVVDQVAEPVKAKKEKKVKAPKAPKASDTSPLGIARDKFNVRPGSKPCVTFDLIYEGGTKAEIVKKMVASGTFWKGEKVATTWLDHIIDHWTQKRGYVGIQVDGDAVKYVR